MPFDRWPDEPDEDDTERRWGNPEVDLPRIPTAPTPATRETDVDPEVFKIFWVTVVFANLALFGLTVGPMVLFFRGNWTLGGVLLTAGAFGAVRTWSYYRAFQSRRREDEPARNDES